MKLEDKLFLAGGRFSLEALRLRLGSFQIVRGIVLFRFALVMTFGESKPVREIEEAGRDHLAGADFPLPMPSIASPGAMLAVVILTDNHGHSVADQAMTAVLLLGVMALTLILLLVASQTQRLIGPTGASVISRVMGIVRSTVAVGAVLGRARDARRSRHRGVGSRSRRGQLTESAAVSRRRPAATR